MGLVLCFGLSACSKKEAKETQVTKPIEATPTDTTPTEVTPTEAKPTEATPTETTPTEVTPTEATPTETTPAETTPTEVIPIEATPTETTPTIAVTSGSENKVNSIEDTVQNTPKQVTELSDDLYSFQVSINDEVIQLPVKYDDLINAGWKLKGDENFVISAPDFLLVEAYSKGVVEFFGKINSGSTGNVSVKDRDMISITLDASSLVNSVKVVLPKQIELEVSSKDDVIEKYGLPHLSLYDDNLYVYNSADGGGYVSLSFNDSGILECINIETGKIYEGTSKMDEVSPEGLDFVNYFDYVAPKEFSSNLFDYTIEIAGDLYEFPIPTRTLLDNGWELCEDIEGMISDDFASLKLRKGDIEYDFTILAYGELVTDYTFVIQLYVDSEEHKLPVKLSHGITIGMKKADLEEALRGYDVKLDYMLSQTCYIVEKSNYSEYKFYLTDDIVSKIEICSFW